MTDVTPHEVTDEQGIVAWVGVHSDGATADVRVLTPRLVFTPDEAARVLTAVDGLVAGAPVTTLRSLDPLLRAPARDAGFAGGLRDPLRRAPAAPAGAPVPTSVPDYLPDAEVVVQESSPPRRLLRFLATGIDRAARVTARRDGVEVALLTPLGERTMAEPVAATLDALLRLSTRLGPVAPMIPPVRFSINDAGIADGRTAGANAGAGIVLSPMYVDAGAIDRIRKRRDAVAHGAFVPRRPGGEHFAVELVVVHEVGHSLDQAPRSGRLSDTVAARRTLGESIGIES